MARILITGSTDGFGLETARHLVQRKHSVYLHARNAERAAHAQSQCPGAAGVFIADLTNLSETKRMAAEANATGPFDAVVLNAGMMRGPFRKTPDTGVPSSVFVNVAAPYVLAALLHRPKRLVFIASKLHLYAENTAVEDIFWQGRGEAAFTDLGAYNDAKLHVMMVANAVARRFKDVSVSMVDPGWVPTKMGGQDATGKMEDGLETYLMLAEGDYDQSLTGTYFEPNKVIGEPLAASKDFELQEKVVKACEALTGVKLGA